MKVSKEELKEKILWHLQRNTLDDAAKADIEDLYIAVVDVLREQIFNLWIKSNEDKNKKKEVAFLSFEYLPEEFLKRNLIYLDLMEDMDAIIRELGFSLEQLQKIDIVNKLGYGGLGDASFAFLDTAATHQDSVIGYGIRYEGGYSKQSIANFEQLESSDDWLKDGNPWEVKRKRIQYEVEIENYSVCAVAHDIPVLGFNNEFVNTLRLWEAVASDPVDIEAFSEGKIQESYEHRVRAKSITQFLYPSEISPEGKELRFIQEYFFASCTIQDILSRHREYSHISNIEDFLRVRINEIHCILAIPVFIYEYIKMEKVSFDYAVEKANQIFDFTTSRVTNEIMEWWDTDIIKKIAPSIFPIIERLDKEICDLSETPLFNYNEKDCKEIQIIEDKKAKMIPLAIFCSRKTYLLVKEQKDIMSDKNLSSVINLFHDRIEIKKIGANYRVWLMEANPLLYKYLTEEVGVDLAKDPESLSMLLRNNNNDQIAMDIDSIKIKNKLALAKSLSSDRGIVINPYSIFDINTDNFHEARRQLLGALYIAYEFLEMLENPNLDKPERTFFFAGKANRNYDMEKHVIKFINCLSYSITQELRIKDKIKIVFIDNTSMTKMMTLIPTADIAEQLSLPGMEISMNNGLRFVINGGIIIGSHTGTNMEIRNAVGAENIKLFGANLEDVKSQELHSYYKFNEYVYNNENIENFITQLSNIKNRNLREVFRKILEILEINNDSYFVFRDLMAYVEAQRDLGEYYYDGCIWRKMSLCNVAMSGTFIDDLSYKINQKNIWNSKK